jgi:hypothetical protein
VEDQTVVPSLGRQQQVAREWPAVGSWIVAVEADALGLRLVVRLWPSEVAERLQDAPVLVGLEVDR